MKIAFYAESEGASGTLQALKKRYILIGHDT